MRSVSRSGRWSRFWWQAFSWTWPTGRPARCSDRPSWPQRSRSRSVGGADGRARLLLMLTALFAVIDVAALFDGPFLEAQTELNGGGAVRSATLGVLLLAVGVMRLTPILGSRDFTALE